MAQATCLNEDCEKDEPWTLQKAPGEYKNGLRCPNCGSTRVDYEEPERDVPARQGQNTARNRQPAPVDGRGQQPARAGGDRFGAVDGAIALADEDASAAAKTQGAQAVLGTVAEGLGRVFEYQEQKEQAADEKAKQSELTPVEDYPECQTEGCGYQFTGEDVNMSSDIVKCPDCGQAYEMNLPELG